MLVVKKYYHKEIFLSYPICVISYYRGKPTVICLVKVNIIISRY